MIPLLDVPQVRDVALVQLLLGICFLKHDH
jgi:hypothetical protein